MELIKILHAGYVPVSFEDTPIDSFNVDEKFGVVRFHLCEGGTRYVAFNKHYSDLPIEFVMHVKFTEETAASMILSDVAAVSREDIDTEVLKRNSFRRREEERRQRSVERNAGIF